MDDPHLYCAQINFVFFLIFMASVLLITSFPGGGHRQRNARGARPVLAVAPA